MTKARAKGEITPELEAKCDAENQFQRFDDLFRRVISVPKSEVLKAETREKRRRAQKRKRHT
jgi:hypothetical protein